MDNDKFDDSSTEAVAEPTCYRHKDRVTYLSCSECGKSICPDCSHDSPVGQKCAECSKPVGRARVITSRQIQSQRTPVVTSIIVITVVAYLVQRSSLQFTNDFLLNTFAVSDGEWWRAITSAFLHSPSSLMHIGFNMYALYIFGPNLEKRVGSATFAGLYLASAIAGSVGFQYLSSGGALGASGAVFGLFGAVLMGMYPQRNTQYGQAFFRRLLLLIGINLALPLFIANIGWQAHVGGFLAGSSSWDSGNASRKEPPPACSEPPSPTP